MFDREINPDIAEHYETAVGPLIKGAQDNHRRERDAAATDDD